MTEPLGKLIDALYKKREEYRAATVVSSAIKEQMNDLERRLLETMDAVGVESSRASMATATATETTSARIEDWDTFTTWVRRRSVDRIHLFEKRIAQLAYREMVENNRGRAPPGVTTYTTRKISLLKRS